MKGNGSRDCTGHEEDEREDSNRLDDEAGYEAIEGNCSVNSFDSRPLIIEVHALSRPKSSQGRRPANQHACNMPPSCRSKQFITHLLSIMNVPKDLCKR